MFPIPGKGSPRHQPAALPDFVPDDGGEKVSSAQWGGSSPDCQIPYLDFCHLTPDADPEHFGQLLGAQSQQKIFVRF